MTDMPSMNLHVQTQDANLHMKTQIDLNDEMHNIIHIPTKTNQNYYVSQSRENLL